MSIYFVREFKFGFEDLFIRTLVARMGQNEEIFARIMDDKEFATQVKDVLMRSVYKRLNEPEAAEA